MSLDNDQESPLLAADERSGGSRSFNISNNNNNNNKRVRRTISLMLSPLTDESGSGWGVVFGLLTLFCVGSILGLILPKNEALPSPVYRTVSSCIGYTYFLAWSTSFWPQAISNCKRRSTRGLSPEFCGLNVLGFACYAAYNMALFWSPTIRELYRERHGENAEITVQSNDVAFAVHAFVLASVTLFQIAYFDGIRALRPSKYIGYIMCGILAVCILYAALVILHVDGFNWLDYLYMLSFVKILISIIKYVPQVLLNFQRRSTVGWSIWNILLDFTGGTLSILQLILDCADLGDWSGITGNVAKFGLGFVSITFDVIFMLQHYVLFPAARRGEAGPLMVYEDTKSDV
jgi:cystinosin